MKLLVAFLTLYLALIPSCKTKQAKLPNVSLLQPDIAANACVKYVYENGRWVTKDVLPLKDCDLIFGVTWGDYEKLMRFFKSECSKTCENQ